LVKPKIKDESKKERFQRLATLRTRKVLESIRILSNCSYNGLYEYNDEEINQIFKAIEKNLKVAKGKFRNGKSPSGDFFLE